MKNKSKFETFIYTFLLSLDWLILEIKDIEFKPWCSCFY